MLRLARGYLPIHVSDLDTDQWKLNVANGTLDLKTGRLWAHRQKDYLTKLCPTAYVPDAVCPTWLKFLADVFQGAVDIIAYVQRVLGYGLTGDVGEQQLPILWGKGSNGKSTLVETILHTVGADYSGAPPRDLFIVHRQGRHPTELMTLHGKRLMMAQETDAGVQLNEALIKHLTGGDTVTGRGVYENFVSFTPTHKLLLSTNHKPKVRGTDYAVWRRLKLLPFLVQFEGANCDTRMKEKLKAEAEGILAWMVRGCLDWLKVGMGEPEAVKIATQSYATEQDIVGRFLRDCCETGEAYEVSSTELLKAFQEYQPDSELTAQAFWDELENRGYVAGRFKVGMFKNRACRRGLRLLSSGTIQAKPKSAPGVDLPASKPAGDRTASRAALEALERKLVAEGEAGVR
jgi:putative DNA primase/helicase